MKETFRFYCVRVTFRQVERYKILDDASSLYLMKMLTSNILILIVNWYSCKQDDSTVTIKKM